MAGGILPGQLFYPPNADTFRAGRITIAALNVPIQLPDFWIPDGFGVLVKANPANTGICYLAATGPDAVNFEQAYPLVAGELVVYMIKNLNTIWVSGTFIGPPADYVHWTVEQKRGN